MRVSFVNQDVLLGNLKRLGFHPRTIFDVGVANGTPWLYKAFQDAYFYLFEPVPSFDNAISTILTGIKGEHVKYALGSREEKVKFYVPKDEGKRQISTMCYSKDTVPPEAQIDLNMITLDLFTNGLSINGPILLKTDAQGYDLEVAKGAVNTLPYIDFVITEVPVYGPWGGGAELKDYIDFYYSHNFILYDLVEPLRRPDDDRLHSIDLCFANLNTPIAARNLYTSGKETLSRSKTYYAQTSNPIVMDFQAK